MALRGFARAAIGLRGLFVLRNRNPGLAGTIFTRRSSETIGGRGRDRRCRRENDQHPLRFVLNQRFLIGVRDGRLHEG